MPGGFGPVVPGASTVTDATLSTSDITTNNVSTSKHGFAPKAPGDAAKFLNGANPPAWTTPAGGIGGTLGATANAVPVASGTGGATAQATPVFIDPATGAMTGQIAKIDASAGGGTLPLTQSNAGQLFIISPTDGASQFTLPATGSVTAGTPYGFAVISAADQVTVKAQGSHVIWIGGSASSAAGTAISSTKGSVLWLMYVRTNLWFAMSSTGTWALA